MQDRRAAEADKLARASSVLCHALAGRRRVPFSSETSSSELDWKLLLQEIPRAREAETLASWRGRVDAVAARARYGDSRAYALHVPAGELARRLFDLLEQNRVEALASAEFPGMQHNLAAFYHEKWSRIRPEGAIRGVGTGWIETFALIARMPLGAPLPETASRALETHWRTWIAPEIAHALDALGRMLHDPDAFARQSLQIISAAISSEADRQQEPSSGARGAQRDDVGQESTRAAPLTDGNKGSGAEPSGAHSGQHSESECGPRAPRSSSRNPPSHGSPLYDVYTRKFDRISPASDLRDAATLERKRRELDQHETARAARVTRWAHRLQRRLLALQLRSWQFDLDEGVLDASRLARVVTHPLEPLAYKKESEAEFPDTIVSLLVDNSGSMRGASIVHAAACAEILGRVLERCGVATEILGFTTRSWHGGRARRKWIADGCPPRPGRIADLQHVIYKSADEPWRRARTKLGLMLEDDLLKENIDGEALQWAADRLLRRQELRRILIVISDGAPLDEATLAANGEEYLDRHLRATIGRLESRSPIELVAIGIGHDVTTYYSRAVKLDNSGQMGEVLVAQLVELLSDSARRSRQRVNRRYALQDARRRLREGEGR